MPKITFYRQARVDGGMRAGIDINESYVWEFFEPGETEDDPALAWYIDVRCQGPELPTDRCRARQWLREQEALVAPAFQALADKLRVGTDDYIEPYQFPIPGSPANASMRIVCFALRGLEPGTLSNKLRETGTDWKALLDSLLPAEAVVG